MPYELEIATRWSDYAAYDLHTFRQGHQVKHLLRAVLGVVYALDCLIAHWEETGELK